MANNITVNYAKQFDVEPQDVHFAMLVACGVPKNEAFVSIFRPQRTNIAGLTSQHLRVKPQIEALTATIKNEALNQRTEDATGRYRDKDAVITALENEIPNLQGKEKVDALMKIADLQQMKKEESETPETVHYYLPYNACNDCPQLNRLLKQKDR